MAPDIFRTDFRRDFVDYMQKRHPLTEKSAREYYYQLVDVTRVVVNEKNLELPVDMDKARVKAFVQEHAEKYTEVVHRRKEQGKRLPFLGHIKDFLSIRTLKLPPRNSKSILDHQLKNDFITWLTKERFIEVKSAQTQYYLLVELVNSLLNKVGRSIDATHESRLNKEMCKQVLEQYREDLIAIILDRHQEKKKQKTMSFLNHVKVFFGLHSLVLPNWSDRTLINHKLKKEFMKWLRDERCLSDLTVKQYFRELSRVVRVIFVNHKDIGGEELGWGALETSMKGGKGADANMVHL